MRDKEGMLNRWYADLYDQEETQTEDIDFLISLLGPDKLDILEACCGSGRILVPLARAGHHVTGFDQNDFMMAKIEEKALGLSNIIWYNADAVKEDWGNNFDVVVLAGNILINIESEVEYKEAQELFIQKSYDSLKEGGHLYLDFNLFQEPDKVFCLTGERVIFEGFDLDGNYGSYRLLDGKYDCDTQISTTNFLTQLKSKDGNEIMEKGTKIKHIPTIKDVVKWLDESGFQVENMYGDYMGNSISEVTERAIIWAKKGEMKHEYC